MKSHYTKSSKLRTGIAFFSLLFASTSIADTVAHWKFDEPATKARIDKVTSNNHTLSALPNRGPRPSDAAPSAGSVKASAAFAPDGKTGIFLASDDVLAPLNFAGKQPFTIEGWFYLDALDPARPQAIISNRGKPDGFSVAIVQGKFLFQVQAGGTALVNLSGTTELDPKTWYYFVAARNENGQLSLSLFTESETVETVTSKQAAGEAIDSDSKTYIGRWGDRQGAGGFLNGKISEIRISNDILSPEKRLFAGKQ